MDRCSSRKRRHWYRSVRGRSRVLSKYFSLVTTEHVAVALLPGKSGSKKEIGASTMQHKHRLFCRVYCLRNGDSSSNLKREPEI